MNSKLYIGPFEQEISQWFERSYVGRVELKLKDDRTEFTLSLSPSEFEVFVAWLSAEAKTIKHEAKL